MIIFVFIAIEILKRPHELTKQELSDVFKKATGFNFQSYQIDELIIQKDKMLSFVTVMCTNTGFTMTLDKDYSVNVESSVARLSGKVNVVGITDVLLMNGIIKLNNN